MQKILCTQHVISRTQTCWSRARWCRLVSATARSDVLGIGSQAHDRLPQDCCAKRHADVLIWLVADVSAFDHAGRRVRKARLSHQRQSLIPGQKRIFLSFTSSPPPVCFQVIRNKLSPPTPGLAYIDKSTASDDLPPSIGQSGGT